MKENILFIVADDLNAWIGALGRQPDVQTPHIDALAKRGVLFTHAYCTAPYCNASRMSAFTGCLPTTTGIYGNEPFWDMSGRRSTFVEVLREPATTRSVLARYFTVFSTTRPQGVSPYHAPNGGRLRTALISGTISRPIAQTPSRTAAHSMICSTFRTSPRFRRYIIISIGDRFRTIEST